MEYILAVKNCEINIWKDNNALELLQYVGQQAILSWSIITEKNNNIEKVVKTRLVERCFEDGNSKNINQPAQ